MNAISFPRSIFLFLLMLGCVICAGRNLPELEPLKECLSKKEVDCSSLLAEIIEQSKAEKNFAEHFRFLMESTEQLTYLGHFQLALQALREGEILAQESLPLQAELARNRSTIHIYKGPLDSALYFALRSYKLFVELKDTAKTGIMLVRRGQIQKELGDYNAAMQDYVKGIKIFKDLGEMALVARAQSEMATLAAVTGEVEKAIRYNKEAASYFKSSGDELRYAYITLNMANDLIYIGREDTALILLKNAIPVFKEKNDTYLWMNAEAQTGRAYHQLGDNAGAIDYLERSNSRGTGENFVAQLAYNHEYLAIIYREMGRYEEATAHSRHSYSLHQKIGYNEEFRLSLKELALNYEAVERPDSALKYFKEYMLVTDSLFSLEKQKQLAQLKAQYESDLKEEQIKSNLAEIGFLEQQNQAQRSRSIALALGLFLLLILGAGIISRQRTKMRLNREITAQKDRAYLAEISLKTEEEKRLKAALDQYFPI